MSDLTGTLQAVDASGFLAFPVSKFQGTVTAMAKAMLPEYRILLVGKSGSGKSSTANTLMGESDFPVGFGMSSCTKDSTMKAREIRKLKTGFRLVDTPGLFDPEIPNDVIRDQIVKASACLHPGLHVVLFVIGMDRFTPEERDAFMQLKTYFDEDVLKYTIIVFTKKDEMVKNKLTLEKMLLDAGPIFQDVLNDCGGRVVAIDNKSKGKRLDQVKELLKAMNEMQKENKDEPYLCQVQQVVNTKLEARVTERTDKRIEREPELKKLFGKLQSKFMKRCQSVEVLNETIKGTVTEEEKLKMEIEELRKREQKKEEEIERLKREQKEKEEKEQEQQEEEKRLAKKREQEKEEEERRKQYEQTKKDLEEMARQRKEETKRLAQLEAEKKMQEELAKIKERLQREAEEKIAKERKKLEEEEMRKTKEDVAANKEHPFVKAAIDGVGRAVGIVARWFWG